MTSTIKHPFAMDSIERLLDTKRWMQDCRKPRGMEAGFQDLSGVHGSLKFAPDLQGPEKRNSS